LRIYFFKFFFKFAHVGGTCTFEGAITEGLNLTNVYGDVSKLKKKEKVGSSW
jgi:hypothetical protein